MKIGIYGGTFAPVHNGHVNAAVNFAKVCLLDRVYIMPTFIPPHKDKEQTESCDDRLNMLHLVFDGMKHGRTEFFVSDFEIEKGKKDGKKSYTKNTLKHFSNGIDEIYLLVGTDMFLSLEEWKEPETIFALSTVVLVKRDDEVSDEEINAKNEIYKIKYNAKTVITSVSPYKASSTEVREKIKNGECAEGLLDPRVYKYISDRRLYADYDGNIARIREDLPKYVKEKRIPHVLGVEREAIKIGTMLGLPKNEISMLSVASLLHDITKKWSYAEHTGFLKDNAIQFSDEYLRSEKTLHELTGAYLSSKLYPDVVKAAGECVTFRSIMYHTTGCPGGYGDIYWKIVFLADFIEDTRTYDECVELRNFFYKKVDEIGVKNAVDIAIFKALDVTLSDLISEEKYIHSYTVQSRNDSLLHLKEEGLI